jgi:hypothetical protein
MTGSSSTPSPAAPIRSDFGALGMTFSNDDAGRRRVGHSPLNEAISTGVSCSLTNAQLLSLYLRTPERCAHFSNKPRFTKPILTITNVYNFDQIEKTIYN